MQKVEKSDVHRAAALMEVEHESDPGPNTEEVVASEQKRDMKWKIKWSYKKIIWSRRFNLL